MHPPPWLPRAAFRWLLLILLVATASCQRVTLSSPPAISRARAAATGIGGAGHRLLLADAALPPSEAEQVHWPFHFTLTTTLALVLSLLVAALSNAAGVGGGAIFVPLFNVLLSFSVKSATALSQAVITGGALGAVVCSISRRHPRDASRRLVDYDLALVICPGLLLGVSTGVLLNIVLPTWLMTVLLTVLLFFLAWRTAATGLRMWRMEHDAQQAQQQAHQALPAAGRQKVQPQPAKMAYRAAHRLQLELSNAPSPRGKPHLAAPAPSSKQLGAGSTQAEWQIAAAAEASHVVPKGAPPGQAAGSKAAEPDAPLQVQSGPPALGSSRGMPAVAQDPLEQPSPQQFGSEAGDQAPAATEGANQLSSRPAPVFQLPLADHSMPSIHSSGGAGGMSSPPSSRLPVPAAPAPADLAAAASSHDAAQSYSAVSSSRTASQGSTASSVGSSSGDSDSGSDSGSENGGRLATRRPSWLSAPLMLDGVLEPAFSHSSPAASHWGLLTSTVDATAYRQQRQRSQWQQQRMISQGKEALGKNRVSHSNPATQQEPEPTAASQLDRSSSEVLQNAGSGASQAPYPSFPWSKLAQIAALWLLFSGLQLGKERFSRCSWPFALLYACQAASALSLALLFSWRAGRGAASGRRHEMESKQPILQGNIDSSSPAAVVTSTRPVDGSVSVTVAASSPKQAAVRPAWTHRQLAIAFTVALCGGAVAGTLGIGGGMVLAPLLLELGLHPQAASATSGLLVLFSASTAVLAFAAAGRLNLQYAAVFGSACCASAALGSFLIGRAVRRSGRGSLLVMVLAGIIAAGAVVTTAFSGVRAVHDLASGTNLGPGSFCR